MVCTCEQTDVMLTELIRKNSLKIFLTTNKKNKKLAHSVSKKNKDDQKEVTNTAVDNFLNKAKLTEKPNCFYIYTEDGTDSVKKIDESISYFSY